MARKLKTYLTSLGFFDQAVAAPSMKAALEAWGSKSNLFHQGFAREVDDPAVVRATMAKPGVVLKRPIGSEGPFKETAELPSGLPVEGARRKPAKSRAKQEAPPKEFDAKAERRAAEAFEREKKRQKARQREEAERQQERERRQKAAAKAEAALEAAAREHDKRARAIEDKRVALEKKSEAEDARWRKVKDKLETALRRARS